MSIAFVVLWNNKRYGLSHSLTETDPVLDKATVPQVWQISDVKALYYLLLSGFLEQHPVRA